MPNRWNQQADRTVAARLRRSAGTLRRRIQQHKLRATLLATAILGFTVLYGLEIAAERGGHSLDPTDAMNYNSYALRNDSAGTLYVHRCSDQECAQLDRHFEWIPVRPGAARNEDVYWGPGESAVYAVATSEAGARRCLVLDAGTKAAARIDRPLSSAGPCRP